MKDFESYTEPSKKELRSYGVVMGSVFSLLSGLLLYKSIYVISGVLGVISLIFFTFGLVIPNSLVRVHQRWMRFAQILGAFNIKLILGFIYLTAFTLVRLVFLVTRKDPMYRKFDTNTKTYWVDHPASD